MLLIDRFMRTRLIHLPPLFLILAFASGSGVATVALADEKRNWDLTLGVGAAYAPDYDGASAASPRLRVWADGTYRTEGFGTFTLDSGSLTIAPEVRWDFVESTDAGISLLAGYRTGRNDQNPSFASADDGSARLHGLPDVSGAIDAGVSGHVTVLGVPLFAQVRTALHGSQGTLVNLGVYLPFEPASDFELTVLPTVTWANARQLRALYGVSPTAAVASGFASFDPGAGWQDVAVEIAGNWRVSGGWHFIASAAFQRLLSNAARSPLTQTANQASVLAGIALQF